MNTQIFASLGITLILAATVCCEDSDESGQGTSRCGWGWKRNGYSCYYLDASEKTWIKTQAACSSMGSHLVMIDTHEENKFLQRLLKNDPQKHWTAGNDLANEGQWVWGNAPGHRPYGMYYTNWEPGEPNTYMGENEDCVEIWANGNWNDEKCSELRRFICEKSMFAGPNDD